MNSANVAVAILLSGAAFLIGLVVAWRSMKKEMENEWKIVYRMLLVAIKKEYEKMHPDANSKLFMTNVMRAMGAAYQKNVRKAL